MLHNPCLACIHHAHCQSCLSMLTRQVQTQAESQASIG